MAIQGKLRAFPESGYENGAEGEVGDEMTVHDVQMQPIGPALGNRRALTADVRQIGIQDAGG
jgi:hypothetical protein